MNVAARRAGNNAASSRAVRMFRFDSSAQCWYRVRRIRDSKDRRRQVVQQRQTGVVLEPETTGWES